MSTDFGKKKGNSNKAKNNDMPLKVTSIEQLTSYADGQIIRLPDFAEGQPFYARVKRPSMLKLVKEGVIPNSLLTTANKLFSGGGTKFNDGNEKEMEQLFSVLDVIVSASLIEPTYDQLKENGVELTDDQMMFLFGYIQNGVKQLEPFR